MQEFVTKSVWVDSHALSEHNLIVSTTIDSRGRHPSAFSLDRRVRRIPGISDCFLYFNDDFFPVRPLARQNFVLDSGHLLYFPVSMDVPVLACSGGPHEQPGSEKPQS